MSKPKRKLSFGLQSLFVVLTISTIVVGLFVREWRVAKHRRELVEEISRRGGSVSILQPRLAKQTPGVVNAWLRLFLGDDYFIQAYGVSLAPESKDDLPLILAFPEAQQLRLVGRGVTDEFVAGLYKLPAVHGISLENHSLTPIGISSLAVHSQLKQLRFKACELTSKQVQAVKDLTLDSITFDSCQLGDVDLHPITQVSSLEGIFFLNSPLQSSHLHSLQGAQSSLELSFSSELATEQDVLNLQQTNPNWSITFTVPRSPGVNTIEWKNFFPCKETRKTVEEAIFNGPIITQASLLTLKDRPNLKSLMLTACSINDNDLALLKQFPSLTHLGISDMFITDEGIRALSGLNLNSLSLQRTSVQGKNLDLLAPSLKKLNLVNSEVSDEGFAKVAQLSALEELLISDTNVSEAAMQGLDKLKALEKLELWNTGTSEATITRLKEALPNLKN